jgi:hypothetical protein
MIATMKVQLGILSEEEQSTSLQELKTAADAGVTFLVTLATCLTVLKLQKRGAKKSPLFCHFFAIFLVQSPKNCHFNRQNIASFPPKYR